MRNKIYIEPPESERRYLRLANLGKELGVPVPQVFLEMKVTMPDGKVVHHHRQRSHSWVRNLYNAMVALLAGVNCNGGAVFGAGFINIRRTDGVVRNEGYCDSAMLGTYNTSWEVAGIAFAGGAADNTFGIQVGSGANVESFEDYVLQTLIANGVGAGQLSYVAGEIPAEAYVTGTKTYSVTHVRYMNNNSPGDVLVKEVAIACLGMSGVNKQIRSRDVLGATVTIPASGQLKVTYTISLVYPA